MLKKIILFLLICSVIPLHSDEQLRFSINERINSYGPIFGEEDVNSSRITSLMFLKPIITDEKFNLTPILFEEPLPDGELQTDGKVRYEFVIRDNIFWADGERLTADDIEYTFNVIKNDNVNCINAREKAANIISIKATGEKTLDVIFNQRSKDNLGALTFSILPKHKFDIFDRDDPYFLEPSEKFFKDDPLGCGMYLQTSIIQGIYTFLKRNENFFDSEKQPRFEEIQIETHEEISFIIEEFLGDSNINFMPDVPVTRIEDIINHPGYEIIEYHEFSWQFIAFNLRKPIFQDINFRKALRLAIDKDELNANIFQANAMLISGPFPPISPAYNKNYEPLIYNLIQAKELLLKNNYVDKDGDGFIEKDGEKISLKFTFKRGNEEDEHLATSLVNYFSDIGIDLIPEPLESEKYRKIVYGDHDFDLALVSFAFGTDPDVFTIFHSSEDRYMSNNVCGSAFAEIDEILEEARYKPDRETRMKLYKNIHTLIADKYPGIFLWQKPNYIAFHNSIKGIKLETIDPINIFKYIYKW